MDLSATRLTKHHSKMNETIINIDEYTPAVDELKPMPCQSCGMYQYFSLSYINSCLQGNASGYGLHSFTYSCSNCHEKYSLAQQVIDLTSMVSTLNDRISSLVNIREAENSFDRTVDALTNQFSNFSLSSNVPQPVQQVTVEPTSTLYSTTELSDETSIWVNESKGMQTISQASFPTHSTLESLSTINDTCSGTDYVPHYFQESGSKVKNILHSDVHNTSTSTDQHVTPDANHIHACPNISNPTSAEKTILSDKDPDPNDTTWCTSDGEFINAVSCSIEKTEIIPVQYKHNYDEHIKFIVIGDKTVKDIIFTDYDDRRSCYKVAYQAASPLKLLKSLSYLIKTRFKNTKAVLYQVSIHEIANTPSECLKEHFKNLVTFLRDKNIQLMISGPIPSYSLSTNVFSRVVAIDDWLSKWTDAENVMFVSNFGLFWQKRHLFHRNGTLNRTGALFLTDNITFCIESRPPT